MRLQPIFYQYCWNIHNEQVLEGQEMKRILESHSELLDYISKHSGRPITNVMEVNCTLKQTNIPSDNVHFRIIWKINFFMISFKINQVDYLYDTLLVETIYNKTLPEWTKVTKICESSSKRFSQNVKHTRVTCTMDITFFDQSCGLLI